MYEFWFQQYLRLKTATNFLATYYPGFKLQISAGKIKWPFTIYQPHDQISIGFTLGIQICVGTLSWSESLIIVLQLYCIVSILTNTVNKYRPSVPHPPNRPDPLPVLNTMGFQISSP